MTKPTRKKIFHGCFPIMRGSFRPCSKTGASHRIKSPDDCVIERTVGVEADIGFKVTFTATKQSTPHPNLTLLDGRFVTNAEWTIKTLLLGEFVRCADCAPCRVRGIGYRTGRDRG